MKNLVTTWRDVFTATDRNNRNRYTNFTTGCGLSWFYSSACQYADG